MCELINQVEKLYSIINFQYILHSLDNRISIDIKDFCKVKNCYTEYFSNMLWVSYKHIWPLSVSLKIKIMRLLVLLNKNHAKDNLAKTVPDEGGKKLIICSFIISMPLSFGGILCINCKQILFLIMSMNFLVIGEK